MKNILRSEVSKILLLFFAWRFTLFLIAAIAPSIIPNNFGKSFPYFEERLMASGLPHFIWSFGNFDGVHYLGIAKDAYAYQFTQAFFPLFPILIKLASFLTFDNLIIAAILVSNLAFLVGLVIFYKLISQTYSAKIALWSTLFLLAFPTSYYFGAIYTEGLFFLLIISSFYLFYKGKILAASIIGSFASATRLVGLFLAPSLSLIAISRGCTLRLLPWIVVPLGFLAYVIYLKFEFNNPLYFLTSQSIFGQERSTTDIVLLPQVIWRYFKILTTTNGILFLNAVFELFSTIFALSMLTSAYLKRIKTSWLVFSLLAIITPTLSGTLASMPRYVLAAFPMFIVLGMIDNLRVKIILLLVSLFLLFITTALFTQGYWVA